MKKTIRRLGYLVLFLCVAAGLLLATHNIWLRSIGESLVFSQPPCKADAIVVLAGDMFGHRIVKAGELAAAGWAPVVLVSGAGILYGHNEGDLAIEFAVHEGYPADKFINVPSPARSTAEEARYMVAAMRQRGVHRFLLVTSDFHTRRSAGIYHQAAPEIPFCTVAAGDQDFQADRWWLSREGRKVAFTEWLKTVANALGI